MTNGEPGMWWLIGMVWRWPDLGKEHNNAETYLLVQQNYTDELYMAHKRAVFN